MLNIKQRHNNSIIHIYTLQEHGQLTMDNELKIENGKLKTKNPLTL